MFKDENKSKRKNVVHEKWEIFNHKSHINIRPEVMKL